MKRRHVLSVLALSYVTLGIYMLYWLYKTRKELLAHMQDKKAIPKVVVLFVPIFAIVGLLILSIVIEPILANVSHTNEATRATISLVLTLIALGAGVLAVFIVHFWWFYRYFRALEFVVQGNDAMLFYTLWIVLTLFGLGPIWVLLTQSDLNKFIDNGYRPLKPAYPPNPHPDWQTPQPPTTPGQQYHPQPYAAPAPESHTQYASPAEPEAHQPHHSQHHQSHHYHPDQHQPRDEQHPPQQYQG